MLRSKHTGNSVGYGVIVKQNRDIQKDGFIGHFEGSRILTLNSDEHEEMCENDKTWQFYSAELALNTDMKRNIRLQQGREYIDGIKYTAYLDCSDSARAGICLLSYCNSPKDAYTFYGAEVETNAYFSVAANSTTPSLHANKRIRGGTEILWSYRGLRLPRTLQEEMYSKISGDLFQNEWRYPFSRADIIRMLTGFNSTHHKYNEVYQFLNEAIEHLEDTAVKLKYRTIDLTNKSIAKHRLLSSNDVSNNRVHFPYLPQVINVCVFHKMIACNT